MKAKWYIQILALTVWTSLSLAGGVFPCPDCEQPVSHRALMCPNCGCPGDAVREAYEAHKAEEEGPPPVPVVQMTSEHTQTFAVALRCDDAQYVLADLWAVGATTRLGFKALSTEETVAYRSMQIARDAPLVRFRTDYTELAFLERSPTPEAKPEAWLDAAGEIIEQRDIPANAVAALDQEHRVLFLLLRENGETVRYPVPDTELWMDVGPGTFRNQMSLLIRARNTAGPIPAEMRSELQQTPWLSPFLKKTAHRLSETGEESAR